jgi:hypothetical protein
MLPVCTSTQKPYVIGYNAQPGFYANSSGNTPAEACQSFVTALGYQLTAVSTMQCNWSASSQSYPVLKICDDSPQLTADKIADMSLLWGLFLVVAIVIYGLRRLLNIFESAPHGE